MKKIENVQCQRDPELPGLEIFHVSKSRHVFPNHSHDGIYAVGLMEKGGSYCLGQNREDTFVAPGQIALINPAQVHSGVPAPDVHITYHMIYMDMKWMQRTAVDICEKDPVIPEFNHMVIKDPVLWKLFLQVGRLTGSNRDRLEKESAVFKAFARLISHYGGIRKPADSLCDHHRVIRGAREFLSENLAEKITLEETAAAVGLSRYHFLRVFKKAAGIPPHVFRTQKRLDAAKKYLKQDMPFADVALETGFTDQSHFTNKFRQFFGVTPRQYLSEKYH